MPHDDPEACCNWAVSCRGRGVVFLTMTLGRTVAVLWVVGREA